MERQLKDLEHNTSYLEAWPFPETMDRADERKLQDKLFQLIIDMFKVRQEFVKMAIQHQKQKPGEKILRDLGMY